MTVPEYPGRTFTASLATTSKSVSDTSGTVLAELMVNNKDDALQAGDYAQVKFDFPGTTSKSTQVLRLPSSALLFRNTGMEAAVVGGDDRVHLHHVTVARDLGTLMEIASGVGPRDKVINNPSDSIADGEKVHVITADKQALGGSE